jgi:hypothetical protein
MATSPADVVAIASLMHEYNQAKDWFVVPE